jgi:phospholipid/cholesterol/gamma-HCH transport system permease protein
LPDIILTTAGKIFTTPLMDNTKEPATRRYLVSRKIDKIFLDLHRVYMFNVTIFKETFSRPFEFREVINQFYEVGVRSLPLITLTGFIIGIVFTNQSRPSLSTFGATSWLPSLISIAIVRALAPLVTSIITAARVGSNIGAEIGSMRVTEQIDAMEVSAINPFKFLVVTRVLATTFMVPLLMMYTILVALLGSYLNVNANEQTSFITFMVKVFDAISFLDLFSSVIKSVVFGYTIGMISCYKGYFSSKGTEGVGRAANSSVVTAIILVFLEELLSLQIITMLRVV